jgi:hypothetical protein
MRVIKGGKQSDGTENDVTGMESFRNDPTRRLDGEFAPMREDDRKS